MCHVAIPYKWKEFLFHCGCSVDVPSILTSGLNDGGGESKEGRQTIFFTPLNPFGNNPDEEEPGDDLSTPRKVHYHRKWKNTQDAENWINLARAQHKGSRFWQTRSHGVIVYSSVPADCIYKVISQKTERTFFERLSTPRPAPKIVLKGAWQSQQQQQKQQQDTSESASSSTRKLVKREEMERSAQSPVKKEEPECKVDVRIEGIAQDVILKDEERMGKNPTSSGEIQEVVHARNLFLKIWDSQEKSIKFSEESSRLTHEMGNTELYELGQASVQCHSCLKHMQEGLTFLFLVAFVFDLMKKQFKSSKPDSKL